MKKVENQAFSLVERTSHVSQQRGGISPHFVVLKWCGGADLWDALSDHVNTSVDCY